MAAIPAIPAIAVAAALPYGITGTDGYLVAITITVTGTDRHLIAIADRIAGAVRCAVDHLCLIIDTEINFINRMGCTVDA